MVDGPPEGSPYPEYASVPENFVPEHHPEEIFEIAQKLVKKA
ncbi:MAG TPA: hypothetical protein VHS80_14860 [Chthoniobacterales bacterium]|nr:hypothetical protein [Chthoniobacterales bacterium]